MKLHPSSLRSVLYTPGLAKIFVMHSQAAVEASWSLSSIVWPFGKVIHSTEEVLVDFT